MTYRFNQLSKEQISMRACGAQGVLLQSTLGYSYMEFQS